MKSTGGRKPSLITIEPLKPLFLTAGYACLVQSSTGAEPSKIMFGSLRIENFHSQRDQGCKNHGDEINVPRLTKEGG